MTAQLSTDQSPEAQHVEAQLPEDQRRSAVFVAERPWGQFQQFVLNQHCTVKLITVEPGRRLSLQKHALRDELWQVLDVPLDVQVGERQWTAQVGERIYTPAGSLHRLGNSGTQPGRILEVAFGHFDEQDIVRLQDDYARPETDRG
ncbi:phosphomannose isomerase type II C-terminal cupin domain [Quadrisphaera granulorum]|uniref:phosphomannose isomerase type II C-terminal cupin domain n=1 Tax=Quadrisphaera granulorum TaxID=317664 RepID=UPI001B86E75E|nr:phosphomannose isomerase type II C-terminal cupin domain [Quadrisphaera granulorum]